MSEYKDWPSLFFVKVFDFISFSIFIVIEGIPGTKIHFILETLTKVFPDLIETGKKEVPCLQWVNNLRDDMPKLNDEENKKFVAYGERFAALMKDYLSSDKRSKTSTL